MKNYLKNKRLEKGLTQKELASLVNATQQQICNFENGLTLPSAKLLVDLSKILGFNLNDLKNINLKGED
jgi:transcriptional regulator with XRE-family HTH domain